MNWKKFLKPTKVKIIITLAIFLILYSSTLIYIYAPISVFYRVLTLNKIEVIGNFHIVLNYIINPSYPAFQNISIGYFILDLVYLPLLFLYWYVISCFIVWICNKVKKK